MTLSAVESFPIHPQLRLTMDVADAMMRAAATGYDRARKQLRPRRRGGSSRRPGYDSPLWNVLATELRRELRPWGAKARMARYLGIPRQRITEFLRSKRRLPDAELTLRLLHWLQEHRAGRDLSV